MGPNVQSASHRQLAESNRGYIYWDNSDNVDDDAREAEKHLLEGIQERHGECQYFLGFPPTTFHVTRGMLARL